LRIILSSLPTKRIRASQSNRYRPVFAGQLSDFISIPIPIQAVFGVIPFTFVVSVLTHSAPSFHVYRGEAGLLDSGVVLVYLPQSTRLFSFALSCSVLTPNSPSQDQFLRGPACEIIFGSFLVFFLNLARVFLLRIARLRISVLKVFITRASFSQTSSTRRQLSTTSSQNPFLTLM